MTTPQSTEIPPETPPEPPAPDYTPGPAPALPPRPCRIINAAEVPPGPPAPDFTPAPTPTLPPYRIINAAEIPPGPPAPDFTPAPTPALPPCRIINACAALTPYRKAWDWQLEIAAAVRNQTAPETILLLQHPHTYTRGRLSPDSHLLLDANTLAARSIAVVDTDRGGLITYHGPGQLVAYPIIRLRGRGGPRWYIRTLEQTIIRALADFGLPTTTVPGMTGVWTADGQRKIAAIGVKIAAGVTHHGFAININPDLTMFDGIIPCGITHRAVTSLAAELPAAAPPPPLDAVANAVTRHLCAALSLTPA